jgi:LmbE family N-acetylglucosaminyl deacetylase
MNTTLSVVWSPSPSLPTCVPAGKHRLVRTPTWRQMQIMVIILWIAVVGAMLWPDTGCGGTIVVLAPHPDDAEASCGGLIANAVAIGDTVYVLTMTGGELGIWGKAPDEARAIREAEARNAAGDLGAQALFFGGMDGSLSVDTLSSARLLRMLVQLHPSIVLAPWPLDVHPDHQATGVLAWRVVHNRALACELFFYETSNSPHTRSAGFVPTDYVDITGVLRKKQSALYKQASQHPEEWWPMYEAMALVNGYAADVEYAEAYVRARVSSGMGGRPGCTPRTLQIGRY